MKQAWDREVRLPKGAYWCRSSEELDCLTASPEWLGSDSDQPTVTNDALVRALISRTSFWLQISRR